MFPKFDYTFSSIIKFPVRNESSKINTSYKWKSRDIQFQRNWNPKSDYLALLS